MIKNLKIIRSESLDAHYNQAVEGALTEYAGRDTLILYLWQNEHTVFIGKHQNAYLECKLDLLFEESGKLARRITGGGAVYHDLGNVNYTFIAPREYYDERRQFEIVLEALRSMGLDAVLSGRNDITIDGRKFSGNAFYRDRDIGLHHGTLLLNSDYAMIGRYLTASKVKLQAKGVDSVRSRIVNLCEFEKGINKDLVYSALIDATTERFVSAQASVMHTQDIDSSIFDKWHCFFCDKNRIVGDNVYYDVRIEDRFDFGTADIRLKVEGAKIVAAKIYTDCLNLGIIDDLEKRLMGADINNIDGIIRNEGNKL